MPTTEGKTIPELAATTAPGEDGLFLVETDDGPRKITLADLRDALGNHGLAQFYMLGNATGTSTPDVGTFYKVAGTTTSGVAEDFTLASNRATYTGPRAYRFHVQVACSFLDGNNQTIAVRVSKNGTTIAASEGRATTDSGGRTSTIVAQAIVELAPTDYIEVWVANLTSGGGTTTAVNLNLTAKRA
jgi:hypothetical protein